MAVFTRPAARSALAPGDFGFVAEDVQVLVRLLQKRRAPQGGGRQRAAVRPARHRQDRAGQGGGAGRGPGPVRGRIRRPRRQQPVRPRPLPLLQIAQVFLKGTQQAALLFDEVEDVFPPVSVDAAGS
jgi:hypothetical protein